MASVTALRDALQTRLATISGLHAYAEWPDSFDPPGAIVVPRSQSAKYTLDGNFKSHFFRVTTAVALMGPGEVQAQDALDPYWSDTGASSIEAAILGDHTLGGIALGIPTILGVAYGLTVLINGIEYLGCEHDLEIMTG